MPTVTYSEEIALRSRRFSHLAVLRLLLAGAYLLVAVPCDLGKNVVQLTAACAFVLYGSLLLGYRFRDRV